MTLAEFDKEYRKNSKLVCGCDEAGRGPLAGDVFAAAVIFDEDTVIEGINDSKKLTEKKREKLFDEIKEKALYWSIKRASVEEIENINILQSAMLAMKRAVEDLPVKPDICLIDGNKTPELDVEAEAGKRQFIDYDTFTSFDAEEDTEMELDMGEYTTNVEGYFLDRGIRFGDAYVEETNENDTYIEKGIKPFFYVHNQKKLLDKKPFDNPMQIDMIDVKSILVYDQPMTLRQLTQLTPLLNDYHRKHIDTEWFQEVETSWDRYYLIDIQIKEDKNLLFYGEIRDMGRRYTKVQGYARPVQFYSPEYPDGPISGDIDPRRTLYWNPNVVTDNDGRARVEFYNNNFTRKFTIKAAGITASGIPYILNQNW